ncbi:MAG: hypothetical protein KC729_21130, partial [Candidatus Eisenbacteria bacterium]|nr:hypothetical protein [Candidatus Eisenbacteria bacterium]
MRDLFRLPFTSWSVSVLLFLMIGAMRADAGTVVSGAVSGTWNLAGSPYWVEGDLQVLPTTTLTVEPGVEVRFRGPYRLSVIGTLRAVGTVVDSILFTRDQPMTAMDWRGIRMVGANDASTLEYCRIEHVTAS